MEIIITSQNPHIYILCLVHSQKHRLTSSANFLMPRLEILTMIVSRQNNGSFIYQSLFHNQVGSIEK